MLRNAPICSRRHSPMGMRYRLESNTCAQQLSSHPKINTKNGAHVTIGPAAICGSQRGAHLRRFPKHRFLVKCLAISVDHRPDRLARRFRVGMH